jgi:hypothetical protein
MPEKRQGDRIVVTGSSAGSHFPKKQAEIHLGFEADGRTAAGPFSIDGAVYGRNLRFRGPGTVMGPVLGRGDITIEAEPGGPVRFLSGVHASSSIVAVGAPRKLQDTLVASAGSAGLVVRGDAIGDHVMIEDAVVFGCIRARTVVLRRCIVFGQVLAREQATLVATTFMAYEAPRVSFEGPCCALFALGSSHEAPEFREFTDGAGRRWPCDIRFYPAFRSEQTPVSNRPWSPGADPNEYAQSGLYPPDWICADLDRKREDGSVFSQRRFALTVAGRALNFETLSDRMRKLVWMLRTALEIPHYGPDATQRVQQAWAETCNEQEAQLLRLATG